MLAPFGKPARVIPFLGYRSRDRLVLTVRALRGRDPDFTLRSRWRATRTLLEQFISREVDRLTVTLELRSPAGKVSIHRQASNRHGYVHFDIPLEPEWELPLHPVWETVSVRWRNRHGQQEAVGHVLAPGSDGRLAVISDIDDTIIETGITGGLRSVARNWRRLFAELPGERIAVPGSDVLFDALSGGATETGETHPGDRLAATKRPFFYVSSSPWNLFAYLVAFIRTRNLPLGPLMLRDWGMNRETFGHGSHGAHKSGTIARLCDFYPDMRFALIGDDTQGDLPAYAAAIAAHPGRIAAIFVRTANPALDPPEEVARAAIAAAGVPLWLGPSYAVGEDFLRAAGFTPHGETAAIVEALEKAP
jgi:phosphatidate phosphatase APP1